ncbi:MAG: sodium:solute symporter family protein [Gemmatimonadetes bacterium]|nr:sodium:solute symporter family protein [Gemmatimonadota bacterium]
MTFLDYAIFAAYMLGVIAVGVWFHRKNETAEDYFVGGRAISPGHVGLSVAATDVGGGFSIGLGGLGYAMGLSGSWLLFTGLVGAWTSAVLIIPRLKRVDAAEGMMTYPDFLRFRYDDRVALVAAVISAIGYLGFTSGQILAGAKLMSGSIVNWSPGGMSELTFATLIIGGVIVAYTVLGGLKAVIYTDTVQWIVLMVGLVFFALPFTLAKVGGFHGLRAALPASYFSLLHVSPLTFVNWFITIAPIWVVAMTLYQRMFASPTTKDAQKAWFIAGLFEWPAMAFAGVGLGMMSRVLFPGIDAELGVPRLLAHVLPAGVTGIVVASYFSAIMSTADSCIIASSGNVVSDVLQRSPWRLENTPRLVRASQLATLVVGVLAILIASQFTMVLDAILKAYSFLVSGLFVPTLGAYFWRRSTGGGAFWGMISGGGTTLALLIAGATPPLGLDPSFWGILVSALVFVPVSLLQSDATTAEEEASLA